MEGLHQCTSLLTKTVTVSSLIGLGPANQRRRRLHCINLNHVFHSDQSIKMQRAHLIQCTLKSPASCFPCNNHNNNPVMGLSWVLKEHFLNEPPHRVSHKCQQIAGCSQQHATCLLFSAQCCLCKSGHVCVSPEYQTRADWSAKGGQDSVVETCEELLAVEKMILPGYTAVYDGVQVLLVIKAALFRITSCK